MKLFLTGATGYIGGSVAARLISQGNQVCGLVRNEERAELVRARGITPIVGTLDDAQILANAARNADVTINAASSDHLGAVQAMLGALAGTGKRFIHTSGSSIVGTQAAGEQVADVYDESTPFTPSAGRAARVALNEAVLAAGANNVHVVILCPSLIYGLGHGVRRHSMQVPWLLDLALQNGGARHIGPGSNTWSNVHIDDLIDLYELALSQAPVGGFYFAENGENSMRELCEAINASNGFAVSPASMTVEQAAEFWGDGAARNTMGSNSRVRGLRAREELGWKPSATSLISEIRQGRYAPGAWPG